MKYVISWRERPAASARDYEAAHERVLEIFSDKFKLPESFKGCSLWSGSAITAAT